jgi:hypothetical protein
MEYVRGYLVAGLLALAGAGGAVIAINLHTGSPRLMGAGVACAIVGIGGGGLTLGRLFDRVSRPGAPRDGLGAAPPPLRLDDLPPHRR